MDGAPENLHKAVPKVQQCFTEISQAKGRRITPCKVGAFVFLRGTGLWRFPVLHFPGNEERERK